MFLISIFEFIFEIAFVLLFIALGIYFAMKAFLTQKPYYFIPAFICLALICLQPGPRKKPTPTSQFMTWPATNQTTKPVRRPAETSSQSHSLFRLMQKKQKFPSKPTIV